MLEESFRRQGWECTVTASLGKLLSLPFRVLHQFDVILVTNDFNRKYVGAVCSALHYIFNSLSLSLLHTHTQTHYSCFCRCAVKGKKDMRSLDRSLFFGYSPLHIPFVVCLVNSAQDEVLMQPCHWKAERPFVDRLIDTIVLESDTYALKKVFYCVT
jgi:hypothetical protein